MTLILSNQIINNAVFLSHMTETATVRRKLYQPVISGEQLYWTFNSTVATDFSGNDRDGTLSTIPPRHSEAGKQGGAFEFDGVATWVRQTSFFASAQSNFSISFFLHKDADGTIYAEISSSDSDPMLKISVGTVASVRALTVVITDDEGDSLVNVTSAELPSGDFVHVALINAGGTMDLYFNGVLQGSGTAYDFTPDTLTADTMYIGFDGTSDYLTGIVDSIMVYNVAISEEDMVKWLDFPNDTISGQLIPTSIFDIDVPKCNSTAPFGSGMRSGLERLNTPIELAKYDVILMVPFDADVVETDEIDHKKRRNTVEIIHDAGGQKHHKQVFMQYISN